MHELGDRLLVDVDALCRDHLAHPVRRDLARVLRVVAHERLA